MKTMDNKIILESKPYSSHPADSFLQIVICKTNNSLHPFVTWLHNNKDGGFYHGDYYKTLTDAMVSFHGRGVDSWLGI